MYTNDFDSKTHTHARKPMSLATGHQKTKAYARKPMMLTEKPKHIKENQ